MVCVVAAAVVEDDVDDGDDRAVCHGYGHGPESGLALVACLVLVEDGCLAQHMETWTHVPGSAGSYDGEWTLLDQSAGLNWKENTETFTNCR